VSAADQVDLVLFRVGGTRYAADLTQVRRVDVDDPDQRLASPLGESAGRRALVIARGGGPERRLRVDEVLGVHRVPADSLRRMPPLVAAPPLSLGAWLDGDEAVILVDLHALT
jgi:chemotaxis signal transduction protein